MKRKPPRPPCPACRQPMAWVLYGMVLPTPKQRRAIQRGELRMGGCAVWPGMPQWVCTGCGAEVAEKSGPIIAPGA